MKRREKEGEGGPSSACRWEKIEEGTMKVAIYARVSSERQDIDLSISAQLKALREYASRNGHTVVKEYVDEAESGRSIDRPGFKEMIMRVSVKSAACSE